MRELLTIVESKRDDEKRKEKFRNVLKEVKWQITFDWRNEIQISIFFPRFPFSRMQDDAQTTTKNYMYPVALCSLRWLRSCFDFITQLLWLLLLWSKNSIRCQTSGHSQDFLSQRDLSTPSSQLHNLFGSKLTSLLAPSSSLEYTSI